MLIFKKTIHSDQYPAYFNAGWRWGEVPDSFGVGVIVREFHSSGEITVLEHKTTPKLVPFKIKRPLMSTVGLSLFDSVSSVYSGADEFEGKDAKTFIRGVEAIFSLASLHKTTITKPIGNSTYTLRIFGCFDNDFQLESYVTTLRSLYDQAGSSDSFNAAYTGFADVWFDFGSKCILSFDKNYLHRLDAHLRVSFKDLS